MTPPRFEAAFLQVGHTVVYSSASVGGGHVSRVTWYTPVQGHGIQLTALQWNDE